VVERSDVRCSCLKECLFGCWRANWNVASGTKAAPASLHCDLHVHFCLTSQTDQIKQPLMHPKPFFEIIPKSWSLSQLIDGNPMSSRNPRNWSSTIRSPSRLSVQLWNREADRRVPSQLLPRLRILLQPLDRFIRHGVLQAHLAVICIYRDVTFLLHGNHSQKLLV
jgi:hypothetical protein